MADVYCSKCGEPWDYYGVRNGDMSKPESVRFLQGEGCPSCGFGEWCPSCNGTGIDEVLGCECRNGNVLGWSPGRSSGAYKKGHWHNGYRPNVKELIDPRKIRDIEGYVCADGPVLQAWFWCPKCGGDRADESKKIACFSCHGTGKLTVKENADLEACKSEMDASDECPIEIMNRRNIY